MAVYVNTNVSSLNGQRYLNNVQNSLNTTYQRLSSGLRINSAKDDSAGLQIADRLTTQINGLNQGNRNANDGIAVAQTIEGGLDEISNMLQRIRTLAVQSANGTLGTEDRTAIQNETDQLAAEITRIAEDTTFGGKTILKGYDGGNSIYGSTATGNNNATQGTLKLHVGANTNDQITMKVYSFEFGKLASAAGLATTDFKGTSFCVSTQCAANRSITSIDKMIKLVDSQRADLGAIQNRLESSIRNQSNVASNSADARSRMQQSIIQQAATSMLMQANTRPQLALSMLG